MAKRGPPTIKRLYTIHFRDNGARKAYVEWSDGSTTEGDAEDYHGVLVPTGLHMGALFDRGLAQGLEVQRKVW
jgi:hypothetical protein